jgi:hypothetical protein
MMLSRYRSRPVTVLGHTLSTVTVFGPSLSNVTQRNANFADVTDRYRYLRYKRRRSLFRMF